MIARNVNVSVVHNGTFCYDPELLEGQDPRTDTEAFLMLYKKIGPENLIKETPGSFSSIVFDNQLDEVMVMRDKHETKPLVLGKKDGRFIASSEDSAIADIGGIPLRDVKGGEIIYITRDGKNFRSHQIVDPSPHPCHFEEIYLIPLLLIHHDSVIYTQIVFYKR